MAMYDLRRLKAFQVEGLDEVFLHWSQSSVADNRVARAASSAMQEDDFLNIGKGPEDFDDAQVDSFMSEFSTKKGTQQQGKHAIEGMDADFLIGPMI